MRSKRFGAKEMRPVEIKAAIRAPESSMVFYSWWSTKGSDNKENQEFRISPRILLNLAGDALHNFTDGLAIGASFSIQGSMIEHDASIIQLISSRGGLATLGIMIHELPHELGDFSTLVRAGCSKKQAILLQFATAVAAMIGAVVGVFSVEGFGKEQLIYVTAGGFVYLAAVTILPEVLDEEATLRFRILQLLSFASGVAFLYLVSVIEVSVYCTESVESELCWISML